MPGTSAVGFLVLPATFRAHTILNEGFAWIGVAILPSCLHDAAVFGRLITGRSPRPFP
jgi:hypothetical protein